ncbi:Peptidase s41 family protein [Lasiodiplodia theobromae]|uniref:Peptidase s41 family protein n=1 Tax=Lasiodiplodia theobromae TaxID=45133 RepID=UPI0015C34362|nr:Peptidase s41 family protein [Lasiodiplodia theobromae]KAF4539817.1 Peptidase s41 family protein [Lasiodiplodia theobromae]
MDPWQPSPIQSINGEDPERFFTRFAQKHSSGNIEPHADWNSLMYSPAQTIQFETELFRDLVLYPGDTITIVFENGTQLGPEPFSALYVDPGPTGPLETGGDFYNFFVLGLYPAGFYQDVIEPFLESFAPRKIVTAPTSETAPAQPDTDPTVSSSPLDVDWALLNPAYPKPNLLQANVGQSSGPLISGYFLEGTDLAVISIPSFKTRGYGAKAFGSAISQFILKSADKGKKRIVIDLQRNGGGSATLAVDAFKRFFPDLDPILGTRMRAHDMANDLGRVTDEFWKKEGEFDGYNAAAWRFTLASSDWVASNRIDADTNDSFASWQEFYGPRELHGDSFTKTQRYNYSNIFYVTDSLSQPESFYIVYGYEGNPADKKGLFAADSITILTDGLCDSACALFVELMRHEAGVKAVVAGGRPVAGPMQATGGTRGARGHSLSALDIDIDYAKSDFAPYLKKEVTSLPERINDIYTFSGGVNIRDAIRKGQDVPLQFLYDPADCRIFYTQETLFNQTALWLYAGQALRSPDSHCVANSTGQNRLNPPEPARPPPISNVPSDYLDGPLKESIIALGDDGVESGQKQVRFTWIALV